jgi:hypothetical protein
MSWYSQYRGKSCGRILHYIYCYCGLTHAEEIMVGVDSLEYCGTLFATFKWVRDEAFDLEYPVFSFKKQVYNEEQDEKKIPVVREDLIRESSYVRNEALKLITKLAKLPERAELEKEGYFKIFVLKQDAKKFIEEHTNEQSI